MAKSKLYQEIRHWLERQLYYRWARMKARHLYVGGRKRTAPLLLVIKRLSHKLRKDQIATRASAVAFDLLLALFPFILFCLTLLPYLPIDRDAVFEFLRETLPTEIYTFIYSTVEDLLQSQRGDLLSLSIFFAVYAASKGMDALVTAFNRSFRLAEKRSFLRRKWVALQLTFLTAFMIFLATALLIVGRFALHLLVEWGILKQGWLTSLLHMAKYILSFFVLWLFTSVIYYIAPASSEKWRFFSVGSLVAAVGIILVTVGFSVYLEYFNTYNKLYGSIGTLIVLMLWVYLLAFTLLLGFEVNAALLEAHVTYRNEQNDEDE
ncbi:YihY/virulence factor BrkB family protein [Thermonema rossianum]|uniref:YihY/virulence factor BrkB family protein n=1 Tax=Thermonema rossianum TaxID=55505 RepID=UPI00068A3CDE|nr:YihY/virulence factor BrkB family protein [Thermonema rossianum]